MEQGSDIKMEERGKDGFGKPVDEVTIDVMITSSSRPHLLITTVESFLERVRSENVSIRLLLHEDVIDKKKSEECIEWAEDTELFSTVISHGPYIGLGPSIYHMMKNHVTSDLMFYLQDDFVLIRHLDLDVAVNMFKNFPMINQIRYNKRKTMSYVGDNPKKRWLKKEMLFGNQVMTVSPHWFLNPTIWRMNFITDKFVPSVVHCNWRTNDVLKQGREKKDLTPEWIAENMGTFIFGGIGEPAFFQHIGYSDSALDTTGAERKYYRFKKAKFVRRK